MSLSAEQLAELVNVPAPSISGSYDGVSSLDEATASQVSFLGNPRYAPLLTQTKAGAVLVPEGEWQAPDGCLLLTVENPSAAFSKVIEQFQKSARPFEAGVHPAAWVADEVEYDPKTVMISAGAIVEKGVSLGSGTVIGPGVTVGRGAQIGENCYLHAQSVVREGCILHDRVILQPNVVVGSDGFGYEFVDGCHQKVPQVGIVVIEDDVEIGSNSCIDRARFGETRIGKGSKIDNLVQIAHNVQIGQHTIVVAQSGIAGSSKLGNYVTVAAQAGVAGHVEIGDQVILGGRAGATKSLPNADTYLGYPARPLVKEQRKMAALARVPKLVEEVKSLKKKLAQLAGE